jgi:hypothetical protein
VNADDSDGNPAGWAPRQPSRELSNQQNQEENTTMIKLNDNTASAINVLAESELDQVVGGYCHRGGRKGWGYGRGHCGQRDYDKRGCGKRDYEDRGYDDSSDYDRPESSSGSSEVNNQVIQLDITINQVAG